MAKAEQVPGNDVDLLAALRPKWVTVIALWCVAIAGRAGGLVAGVVDAPNGTSLGWILIGLFWAGLCSAMTRPFAEAGPDGLVYRRYGRRMTLPWSSVERVLVTEPGLAPQLLILRRNPRVLVPVEVLAGGGSHSARRDRLVQLCQAAARFAPPRPMAEGDSPRVRRHVRLEESRGLVERAAVTCGVALLLVLVGLVWPGDPPEGVYMAIVAVFVAVLWFRSTMTVRSVEFDAAGLHVTVGRFHPRHLRYASDRIDQVLATPSGRLAILLRDHTLLWVPASLWAGRGAMTTASVAAAKMAAVLETARSTPTSPAP